MPIVLLWAKIKAQCFETRMAEQTLEELGGRILSGQVCGCTVARYTGSAGLYLIIESPNELCQ